MFNIRQWVNRIADGDQNREPSFHSHVDNEREGFICPVCMLNCEEAGLLADHFNSQHSEGLVQDDSNNLRDDEHNDNLTIQRNSPVEDPPKDLVNNMTCQNQSFEDLIIKHKALENKAASIATENVTLKAQIDDMHSVNSSLEVRISLLESQLAHKNTIDDASVLRQELVSVQRMMDSLTVEKEKEIDKITEHLKKLQQAHDEVVVRCQQFESENTLMSKKVEQSNLEDNKLIEMLQQQLKSSENEVKELNEKFLNHAQELDKAKLKIQEERQKHDDIIITIEKELDELKLKCSRMEAVNMNLESIIKDKDDVISELKRSHLEQNTLSESVQQSNTIVMELQREVQELKTKNCTLQQENITLTSISKQNQDETNKKSDKLLVLESQLDEATQMCNKEKEENQNLKKQLEGTCATLTEIKSKLKTETADKAKMSETLQNVNDEKTQMKLELENAFAETNKQQQELKRLAAETTRLSSELEISFKEMDKLKSDLESSIAERNTYSSNLERLKGELLEMESKLKASQEEKHDLISKINVSESLVAQKQEKLQTVVNENNQLIEAQSRMSATLFDSEKKLQAEVTDLKDQCSKKSTRLDQQNLRIKEMEVEKQRLETERASLLETLENLTTDKQTLLLSLEDVQTQLREKAVMIQKLEEEKGHFQGAKRALQEELEASKKLNQEGLAKSEGERKDLLLQISRLKSEMETWEDRYKEEKNREQGLLDQMDSLQKNNNELLSEVRRYEDQEKCLLERCLASQAECEDIQGELNSTRRKLEDSQAALHELGRESQTLQMEIAKMTGRKWTDDSLVSMCESCQKEFTLTVRKHHCRNCGNIFCKDCSSRSATLPSSKKPVRVCDNCYQELMKMGMKSG